MERKHPKYTLKCLFYNTLSICICRFQSQSICLKSFSSTFVTLIMFNKQIWPCYILCVCVCVCSAPSLRSDGGRWMVICRSIATTSVCQEVSFIFTTSSTRTRVYMSVRPTTPKAKTDTKCICLWRVRVTWPYEHTAMRHYWEEQYHMHTKTSKITVKMLVSLYFDGHFNTLSWL